MIAIVLGILIGHFWPRTGIELKPLGDAFIKLIKMIIGPIIFCTLVSGITSMQDVKRVGGKALLYFELISTVALFIGLLAAHLLRPGASFDVDVRSLDASAVSGYVSQASHGEGMVGFLMHTIPATLFDAFAKGEILPILMVSVLFGVALVLIGERDRPLTERINQTSEVFFRIVGMISRVAPLGALGAIAFTVGKCGLGSLVPLPKLIGTFYFTAFVFVACVLGSIARQAGFSIFRLLGYIKAELLSFVALAASLATVPTVPVEAMVLILGVDRFMAECRSLTNIIGNAVAGVVVAAWEGELDRSRMGPIALKSRARLAAGAAQRDCE